MKKIGLALSGGGMRGIAHLGVLKALYELGIVPDIITGTSMGSVIAGLYASGLDLHEMINLFYSLDNKILDVNYKGIIQAIFKRKIPNGFIKGDKIERKIQEVTNGINIKDITNKKIAIVATNLNGGQNIIFSNSLLQGNNRVCINDIQLSKAIRGSISLPIIFTPVILDDFVLVDGGVVNNCPSNLCQELGADIIISSTIEYNGYRMQDFYNGGEILSQTLSILLREANLNDYNELVIPNNVIRFSGLKNIPLINFSKPTVNEALIIGYEDAYNALVEFNLQGLKNK